MNDEVLVRVLNAPADLEEETEALVDRHTPFIAVRVDADTVDILHDEVRVAVRRRAAVEDARDELVAPQVVVDQPAGQADGGILESVERLRAELHLQGIAEAVLVEKGERFERLFFLGREAGRRRPLANVLRHCCHTVTFELPLLPKPSVARI